MGQNHDLALPFIGPSGQYSVEKVIHPVSIVGHGERQGSDNRRREVKENHVSVFAFPLSYCGLGSNLHIVRRRRASSRAACCSW